MNRIKTRLRSGRQGLKYWLQRHFNLRGPECKSAAARDIVQVEISAPEPGREPEPGQEAGEPKTQTIWNSPLECLPAEIRHHILSFTQYEGLKPLVRASPVYHQQYLLDRERLLYGCLERSLGSSTIDACAVYESGLVDFAKTRNQEKINQFLESYKGNRSKSQYLKSFTFDQLISISQFHFVVGDIARYYTAWALTNLAEMTAHYSHGSLSRTEKARIVRGLYRFELYCNLYGSSNHKTNSHLPLDFEGWEVLRIFMGNYKPWEVEEIACIYTFVDVKFNKVFDDIYSDVHPDNPRFKFRRWPVPPDGSFDFDSQGKSESPQLALKDSARSFHLLMLFGDVH